MCTADARTVEGVARLYTGVVDVRLYRVNGVCSSEVTMPVNAMYFLRSFSLFSYIGISQRGK